MAMLLACCVQSCPCSADLKQAVVHLLRQKPCGPLGWAMEAAAMLLQASPYSHCLHRTWDAGNELEDGVASRMSSGLLNTHPAHKIGSWRSPWNLKDLKYYPAVKVLSQTQPI